MTATRTATGTRAATGALLRMWVLDLQGWPRRPRRAAMMLAGVATWWALGAAATAASADRMAAELGFDPLPAVSGLAVVVFCLAPLLGGAGAEAAGTRALARFPVPARSVFASAWVQSLADIQFLLVAPVLCGLAVREGMLPLVGAVAFLAILSGTGVVAGYAGVALAGRFRWPVVAVAVGVLTIVGAVAVLSVVVGRTPDELILALGGFVPEVGAGRPWAVASAALALGSVVVVGPWAVRFAWRTDARAPAIREHVGVLHAGSIPGALLLADVRGMVRPVPVRLSMVSMLAVPLFALVSPGERLTLAVVAPVVVLALTVVLSVNGFAFAGGGVSVLAAAPLDVRSVLAARFTATALVVASGAAAAIAVSSTFVEPGASVGTIVAAVVGQLLACCGVTLWTSVRWPAFADYDSLRVRPAPVTALFGAMVICLPVATVIGVLAGFGPLGGVGALALGVAVAVGSGRAAVRRCDLEAIHLAVR